MRKFTPGLVFGAAMLTMVGTASAAPTTVSASVGPVPLANAPVEVCVDDDCQTTPALSAVTLEASVTADDTETAPTITPGQCGSGAGAVLVVETGPGGGVVSGEVSGTLPDGSSFSESIDPVTVGEGSTTVSACTTVADQVPDPGDPVPDPGDSLGGLGGLGGLVGLVLDLVTGLLGGLGGL